MGLLEVLRRVWRTGEAEMHPIAQYKDDRVVGWRENSVYRLPSGEVVAVYEDKTEQKRMKDALRQSEQLHRRVVQDQTEWVCRTLPDGTITFANDAYCELFGMPREEIVGRAMGDLMPDEVKVQVAAATSQLTPEAPVVEMELPMGADGGGPRWTRWVHRAIFDSSGQLVEAQATGRDVTDRRRAEDKLRASLERYRGLYEPLPGGVVILDRNDTVIEANQAARQMLGSLPGDIVGRDTFDPVWEAIAEDGSPVPGDRHPSAITLRTGRSVRGFTMGLFSGRRDRQRWLLINSEPVYDQATGEVEAVVTNFVDITDLRRVTAELALVGQVTEVLARPVGTAEAVQEVLALIHRHVAVDAIGLRLRDGNDFPYFEVRGLPPEFVLREGRLPAQDDRGEPIYQPDGMPLLECMCGNVLQGRTDPALPFFTQNGSFVSNCTTELLATSTEAQRQSRTRNRCNAAGYETVGLFPLRTSEGTLGLLHICDRRPEQLAPQDVALLERVADSLAVGIARRLAEQALRESEERFRAVFSHASDGISIIDLSGRFVDANPAYCPLLGHTREELLSMDVADIQAPPSAGAASPLEGDPAAHGQRVLERTLMRKDGTSFPAEISTRRVDIGGQSVLLGIARDITQRRLVEDSQRLAAVGELAAGVAHEFNNLLGGMMLRAERADQKRTLEDYGKLADLVLRSAQRGAEVCRNLTAFARPKALQMGAVSPEAAIEAALSVVERQLANTGVSVRKRLDTGELRIAGDQGQIEQVLVNLFINACHAMTAGGTLTVAAGHEPRVDSPGWVAITVADTGTGIEPANLPHIFDPFFTTKGRLGQSDVPGTGLGLSVTHGIVRAHGGTIDVRSRLGEGTAFTLRLPVFGGAAPRTEGDEPEAPARAALPPLTVLLAEDEDAIRYTVAENLEALGHEVVAVDNGRDAIAVLSRRSFDVVITDLLMPGAGGSGVLAAVASLPNPPPTIVVTGRGEPHVEAQLAEHGAACLRKPFSIDELLRTIEGLVE